MYVRERRDVDVDSRKIWVVLAKSSPQSPLPEKSGVQRVIDYKQTVAMESDGACGTKGTAHSRVHQIQSELIPVEPF